MPMVLRSKRRACDEPHTTSRSGRPARKVKCNTNGSVDGAAPDRGKSDASSSARRRQRNMGCKTSSNVSATAPRDKCDVTSGATRPHRKAKGTTSSCEEAPVHARDKPSAPHSSAGPPRKARCKTDRGLVATNPPASSPKISAKYLRQSFKDCMRTALNDGIEASHLATKAEVINDPFTCCVLPQFLEDDRFLSGLESELLQLNFHKKSNDLYKFQQSDALQNFSSPYISSLKKVLYEDFLSWLREVTGIPFTDTFDLTCSKYNYTDVLLCHDDELEGRRVAFILYLVPFWGEPDGGCLDLFDTDEHGQPRSIVKSLVPKWNNFVFFEVTPKSFHQVAEVLSESKCRLSVSGWFHGPTVPRPPPYIEPHSVLTPHLETKESLFYEWVGEKYLDLMNQSQIQETFSEESEIQLTDFFEPEKFSAVQSSVCAESIQWIKKGPANKRNYETADPESLPAVVRECLSVMQSECFFLLLSNFTALRLHEMAPCSSDDDDENEEEEEKGVSERKDEGRTSQKKKKKQEAGDEEVGQDGDKSKRQGRRGNSSQGNGRVAPSTPRCRAEVRRWTHGCYTLIHDTDTEGSEYALDASLFINAKDFNPENGGYASYIAKGEDEELLSVLPQDNSLSLVYRDKETLRFVKHINHSFVQSRGGSGDGGQSQPAFYELYLVYYE